MPEETKLATRRPRWTTITLIAIIFLLLCIVLPPLINLSHFDRQISAGISRSLGRSVHVDHTGVRLLPTPALTLQNFVIADSPDFGGEPVVRASAVTVTLRVASLWRRRIEVSSISLDEPSINLTRNSRGDWNFKNILEQAATISTTPTASKSAPAAAIHFPYIEATHARVNFVLDQEKIPFNLSDSDLALWQSDDGKWRFRVRATPSRTDLNLTDTGLIRAEGSLGPSNPAPATADASAWPTLPLDIQARWQDVPLDQLARLFTSAGQDLRGYLQARATLSGSLGAAHLHADLQLDQLRATDVVPNSPLSLAIACDADQLQSFQQLDHLACTLPLDNSATINLTGNLAQLRNLDPSNLLAPAAAEPTLALTSKKLDAAALLHLARNFTTRLPDSLAINGPVALALTYTTPQIKLKPHKKIPAQPATYNWSGTLHAETLTLHLPSATAPSFFSTAPDPNTVTLHNITLTTDTKHAAKSAPTPAAFTLAPITIPLGATTPATFAAKFTATGYTLHLAGAATKEKLHAFTAAIPWLLTPATTEAPAATPTHPETPIHADIEINQPWPQ